MSRSLFVLPPLALLIGTALLLTGAPSHASDDDRTPVVVELFTSQGCSSCPPADELLSRLGNEGLPGDVEVIPLSFHVDYWNYIGWTDPFSSREWSDRQKRYILALGKDTLFTPALVIHGAAQVVGADPREVLTEIARASSDRSGSAVDVDLRLEPTDDRLRIDIDTRIVDAIPGHGLDLMIALFEKQLVTQVETGENAHRELRNDYVVRVLRRGPSVGGPRSTKSAELELELELQPDWSRKRLGVAAFAQDPATFRIYGAAAALLPDTGS